MSLFGHFAIYRFLINDVPDECTESYVEIYLLSKAFVGTMNVFMFIDKCNVNYDVTLFTAKPKF